MRIAGLQKLTLLDYPGKAAATVFTPGCNFRCPFCHNADLVHGAATADATDGNAAGSVASATAAGAGAFPDLSLEAFFAFLDKRAGLLDGVCITGGEPLLQPDLDEFCARIKERGFTVKLDTNGSFPDRLRALVDAGLVDYVAMDVKNAPERYAETIGVAAADRKYARTAQANAPRQSFDLTPVQASIDYLLSQPVPFEFRTTVVRELHTPADLLGLARWIEGTPAWFLQNYVESEQVLGGTGRFHPWSGDALRSLLPALQDIVASTALRGVD